MVHSREYGMWQAGAGDEVRRRARREVVTEVHEQGQRDDAGKKAETEVSDSRAGEEDISERSIGVGERAAPGVVGDWCRQHHPVVAVAKREGAWRTWESVLTWSRG